MTQPPAQSSATPVVAASFVAPPPRRDVTWTGMVAFLLLGWSALLVPSSIREVESTFGQTDGGMGLAYLLNSILYITGTLSVGWVAGRLVRAPVLGAGPGFIAIGLAIVALAPGWGAFLAGFLVVGLGGGVIDSGINALFMDLYPGRAAGALNRVHLFFAIGALASPLAMGAAVSNGIAWQAVVAATSVIAVLIAIALGTRRLPPVHAVYTSPTIAASAPSPPSPTSPTSPTIPTSAAIPAARATRRGSRTRLRRLPLPLVALAVAIATYIAAEIGISSWLVRYLDDAPVAQATLALSLFWGGLALGRFVSSLVADRVGAVRYALVWTSAAGVAVLASLLAPTVEIAIVCFAIAGFAAGPVYPMIVAIGGHLYPGRSSVVSGVLVSASIVGSIVYPPLMGVMSDAVGLRVGMLGAGIALLVSAASILVASRLARGRGVVRRQAAAGPVRAAR